VCKRPKENASCLALEQIREKRDDDTESEHTGERFDELSREKRPPCFHERGSFMAPFDMTEEIKHPYSEISELHENLNPYSLRHPPYSATAIPFRWMLQETGTEIAQDLELDVRQEREPDKDWMSTWFQEAHNQRELLETFHSAVEPGQSLCFFYAKQTPLTDDPRRVLIGAGRIRDTGSVEEYEVDDPEGFRACVWHVAVEHSIRPHFEDGFLLPYQQIIEKTQGTDERNLEEYAAFAPDDRRQEFSYAAEHVTQDGAIGALLSCKSTIEKSRNLVEGSWSKALDWIDDRLNELWTLRGPYPGLGAAINAFGINQGTFLAREVSERLDREDEDPWEQLDELFEEPGTLPKSLREQIGPMVQRKWQFVKENKETQRELLKLLSRFEITSEQATRFYEESERDKAGIECTDQEILDNPYLLYEEDRFAEEPISLQTVDRGIFREGEDQRSFEDLETFESIDHRRVRALLIHELEKQADQGNTLVGQKDLIQSIRDFPVTPDCPLDSALLEMLEADLSPAVQKCFIKQKDGERLRAFQLGRFEEIDELIRSEVQKRHGGNRHTVDADWEEAIDDKYGDISETAGFDQETEKRARTEKAAALRELSASRLSVLLGPAGTGKTDVISLLCQHEAIKEEGVLLLAPTGKARVRMLEATEREFEAKTLAQFLLQHDRYDPETGRYHLSQRDQVAPARTIVIDEASMLTEEQMAALFDAVHRVKRFIFVGDPNQLPPIGPGRPLLDIATHIRPDDIEDRFPRVSPGYAELTVMRRQGGESRRDVQLARLFSRQSLGAGEDEVLSLMQGTDDLDHLRLAEWEEADDLRSTLLDVLVDELGLEDTDDEVGFGESLGGTASNGNVYFNRGETANSAESWQVLTPLRGSAYGTRDLNRLIQKTFRSGTYSFAQEQKQIPKPVGTDEIVYGDKVINVQNRQTDRNRVWPDDNALRYVANGEIGVMVDHFKTKGSNYSGRPSEVEIEFSSQPGEKYTFYPSDFQGGGDEPLRLAYTITVHKSQGSGFDRTVLVLPNPCRLLSRELLYTALTRQRERVVILHQGDRMDLQKYTSDYYSDAARRLTNLFEEPEQVEVKDRFLESNLIHVSRDGEPKRSKSEVIIANELLSADIDFEYEAPLAGEDGGVRYPDFTIEDYAAGETYYWEHCGMLDVPEYRRRWESKKDWYRDQEILPQEEGGGERGTLLVTKDDEEGGIDSEEISDLIGQTLT
jgi:ATP-dependent exoDNAse (exonuclease V) alpha subunit